jgi:hypothetical protein
MAKQADEERGLVVTADGIVVSLQYTTNSELKKALKDGWKPVPHSADQGRRGLLLGVPRPDGRHGQ